MKSWLITLWSNLRLPSLLASGISLLGFAFILGALLKPWYRVPETFTQGLLQWISSPWEWAGKAALLLLIFCCFIKTLQRIRANKNSLFLSIASAQIFLGIGALLIAVLFTHFVLTQDTSTAGQAAWVRSQYDSLTWFGGDIYTAREFELSGTREIMVKDPPQLLSIIPLPYFAFDLALIGDLLRWSGLNENFWFFLRSGWGLLGAAGIFLIVGGLSYRAKKTERGFNKKISAQLWKQGGLAILFISCLVCTRVYFSAKALSSARDYGDKAQHQKALNSLQRAHFFLPALKADSGLILQEGIYHSALTALQQNSKAHPSVALYRGLQQESLGQGTLAEQNYQQLLFEDIPLRYKREALRALLRRAIDNYNSGNEESARRTCDTIVSRSSALPKLLYLQMLLELQRADYPAAHEKLTAMQDIFSGIQIPLSKAVMASGRAQLAKLSYQQGLHDDSWKQWQLRKKGR